MPSFDEVLNNRKSNERYASATPNVIAFFGTGENEVVFGKHVPDSGLVIEERALIIDNYKTPKLKLNFENATTSFPSTSLDVLDVNGDLFNILSINETFYNGDQCLIFLGFINAGMDFSEYRPEPRFKIEAFSQKSNGEVKFKLTSFINDGNREAFQISGALNSDVSTGLPAQVNFLDEDLIWPNFGFMLINDELAEYNNKTPTGSLDEFSVDLIDRGVFESIEENHSADTNIFLTDILEAHPVDLVLQLLTSTGTGTNGIYDILSDGAGIPIDDIDVFSFNDIRADNPSDKFRLFVNQLSSVLKYIESDLLKPNNYRLAIGDKISLILAISTLELDPLDRINDDDILAGGAGISSFVDSRKIVNTFLVKWAETPDGRFLQTSVFEIQQSIDLFGVREETLIISGAQNDLFGKGIISERALNRGFKFGFNQSRIKIKTNSRPGKFRAGDKIQLTTSLIASLDSSTGHDRAGEIMSISYDHLKSTCTIDMVDSPWLKKIRTARFAPSPEIITVISTTQFLLAAGKTTLMEVGHVFRFFDISANQVAASGNRIITEIVGDTFTIDAPFDVTPVAGDLFWPATYDDSIQRQRDLFVYFSDEANDFPNGEGPFVWSFG